MRIESSLIDMSSSHSYAKTETSEERLKYWNEKNKTDSIEISKEGIDLLSKSDLNVQKTKDADELDTTLSDKDKQKIKMLEEFITRLTGKKFKFHIVDKIRVDEDYSEFLGKIKNLQNSKISSGTSQSKGWGLDYSFSYSHQESEKMTFSTKSVVKTGDGRTIDFSLDLNMSREFVSQTNINIKAGDALIDPLVINYSGKNLNLTNNKISFDINMDGGKEQIAFPKDGCGFLVLDKNNDGTINDGKELFGPSTGNGFDELKKYDSDNNNWIDENDAVFDKLQIWTKDENGNDKLFAIGQAGVGAIYLGNIDTEYSLNNNANENLAKIKSSSVFLREDGTTGTIQHIDFSV